MTPLVRLHVLFAILLAALTLATAGCEDAATATSPTPTSPVTETFSGQLVPGGSAARAFTAASSGTASITLAQIGPPADLVVGLGIGIPQPNGSGCYLTQTVQTGASSSPQITVPVDAGTYCLRLHDPGTLAAQAAFSVTIVRP
ncbi:MAG TPA: hypothetical protein VFD69_22160 [Vicinamibacterales bacterium]|nr:hypothetical protein [Vicinamibacterales bacterium]